MLDATWRGSETDTGCDLPAMTSASVRPSRWFIALLLATAFMQQGCDPVDVRIVGTFDSIRQRGVTDVRIKGRSR